MAITPPLKLIFEQNVFEIKSNTCETTELALSSYALQANCPTIIVNGLFDSFQTTSTKNGMEYVSVWNSSVFS